MQRPRTRLSGPVLDAMAPVALAQFYERLLGWPIASSAGPGAGEPPTAGWAIMRSPAHNVKLEFQFEPNYVAPTWPSERGDQLMMIHLDVAVEDLDAGVAWALDCGARLAGDQPQEDVRVMLDPEGHPFCLFEGPVD